MIGKGVGRRFGIGCEDMPDIAGELSMSHNADGSFSMTHQPHGEAADDPSATREDWPRGDERYFGDPGAVGPFGGERPGPDGRGSYSSFGSDGPAERGRRSSFGSEGPLGRRARSSFGAAPSWAAFGFDPSDAPTVKAAQAYLNANGFGIPALVVDGQSGPKTASAVKAFQLAKGVNPSGVIDDTTLTAMGLMPTGKPVVPEGGKAGPAALATALASVTKDADVVKAHLPSASPLSKIVAAVKKVLHLGT